MQINNIKHDQQSNTKLSRKLIHRMTSYEARGYELAYAEYNMIHDSLCVTESTITGEFENKNKIHKVKEIF